jgi:hypothetical protein
MKNNSKLIIFKSQLSLYINFMIFFVLILYSNSEIAIPFIILCLFLPILNKNRMGLIEFIFFLSFFLIFIRLWMLVYYDFSFIYIKFFPLDKVILIDVTNIALTYMLFLGYMIFLIDKLIEEKDILKNNLNLDYVNTILTIMLTVKLVLFFYAKIKMGESTDTLEKIIDMLIANLFLIDLLFLISFLHKRVSKLNILLYILISVVMTSKSAVFMLFLLYIVSISKELKFHRIFNIKYFLYMLVGVVVFIFAAVLSNAARTGDEIKFIFLSIDSILALFRRLGILDNILAIWIMDKSDIEYFSFYNLIIQFILGFIPNSLFDFGYYGVSTGWAVAHYGLGQPDDIINAYEASAIGTAILFSHQNIFLSLINLLLIYSPILLVFYFTKDAVLKYYAIFMFILITITGDIRVDALLIKHIIIYKLIILPLITYKKGK